MDFQEEEFNEILKIFQVESDEIISRINNNLLELEKNPKNKDVLFVLFRDAHSLKGAARMVGFNNIQNLAHKVEDILGLAKDDQIKLNSEIVNILYKSIDFLSEVIVKSINQKTEFYDENIISQIKVLESIKNDDNKEIHEEKQEEPEFSLKELRGNIEKINLLISESLFELMLVTSKKDASKIKEFSLRIDEMFDIFQKIGIFEIKKALEDIKVKLDFVIKTSGDFTSSEVDEFQKILDGIILNLVSVCEIHNIKTLDYYSMAFDMFSQNNLSEAKSKKDILKEPEKELAEDFENKKENVFLEQPLESENINNNEQNLETEEINYGQVLLKIKDMFEALKKDYSFLGEIKQSLFDFEIALKDEKIKSVIKNLFKTVDFSIQNKIKLNEDNILALSQGLDYCIARINKEVEDTDAELILQRLNIVQQVLELSTIEEEEKFLPQKKQGLSKKISDLSAIFDTGEIKTLRVDSLKLDSLVNQVGELMVTKIKSKKHLHELDYINNNLSEWQKHSAKVLNHLKSYEKRLPKISNEESQSFYLMKSLLNVFEEQNKKFSDTIYEISNLKRIIQEDDMKTNFILDDLEGMVKNIRVLPLATIFHLFGRMVRDIAQEKNKNINLEIIGSETSTDKKIIEEIKTPLIHIIRNAIDHGIETPEERISIGKEPAGKILLKAYHSNNKVIIEIHDDGRGINVGKIKEKAVKKGYLSKEEADSMTDEQITNLIFAPGFSTGEEITSISGRGIGLDVVQTKISQLNGKVKVLSEVNKGCCVIIELPTTMSTLKSFLVKASNQIFAIPMNNVYSIVKKELSEIFFDEGYRTIILNGKTIPIYNLSEFLNLPVFQKKQNKTTILILESDNKIIGLEVDKLLGDQEVLQKKLSAPLYRLKNISGVTTLASGDLCFILNVSETIKNISKTNLICAKHIYEKYSPQNYSILLVDDSITTRTLEKNILTRAGFKIQTASNPIEAFEKLKEMRFDLIISDIEMPEMNGFEFLQQLKADEMYFDIPVIMLSSLFSEEHRLMAKEYGAKGYVAKREFNQEEFLKIIQDIL